MRSRSSLMLRCLILMLHLTEVAVCLYYIIDWKRRSGGSMSSTFVMWRWDVLPLWCFQLSGAVCLLFVTFFKRLASLLADKKDVSYSVVMSWLRCRVSFSLLRSGIDCLRGARSSKGHPANLKALADLAISEGQLSLSQ